MQRGIRILLTYLSIAVVLVLLAFVLPDRTAENTNSIEPSCAQTEGVCTEPGKVPADDLMLENLSRQFIFVSPVN